MTTLRCTDGCGLFTKTEDLKCRIEYGQPYYECVYCKLTNSPEESRLLRKQMGIPLNQFEQKLQEDSQDWLTRLVYADWLEDHDQLMLAYGQRKQVEMGKRPLQFSKMTGTFWYQKGPQRIDPASDLLEEIFVKLTRGKAITYLDVQYRRYPTRQIA